MKILLLFIMALPCNQIYEHLRKILFFEADFTQLVRSGDYVYKKSKGHLWYSRGKAKIEVYYPDTEYILIGDTTIKTLNTVDSTLIIQRKTRRVDFFLNMISRPNEVRKRADSCVAIVIPDSGNIDSLKVIYTDRHIKNVTLYQGEIEVFVKIRNFKPLRSIPDSVLKLPYMAGVHIIRF